LFLLWFQIGVNETSKNQRWVRINMRLACLSVINMLHIYPIQASQQFGLPELPTAIFSQKPKKVWKLKKLSFFDQISLPILSNKTCLFHRLGLVCLISKEKKSEILYGIKGLKIWLKCATCTPNENLLSRMVPLDPTARYRCPSNELNHDA